MSDDVAHGRRSQGDIESRASEHFPEDKVFGEDVANAGRLERLCRYIARPPLSLKRLEEHPAGRVRIRFKSAWKDGTHSVLLDPLNFVSGLCALIPPRRFHMLRYQGVLAGHSRDRAEVVPQ